MTIREHLKRALRRIRLATNAAFFIPVFLVQALYRLALRDFMVALVLAIPAIWTVTIVLHQGLFRCPRCGLDWGKVGGERMRGDRRYGWLRARIAATNESWRRWDFCPQCDVSLDAPWVKDVKNPFAK